jgi:hypothetical protein
VKKWVKDLGRWPLLLAAALCVIAAIRFEVSAGDTEEARSFLLAVGAVLIGAWVALLASWGHDGVDDEFDEEEVDDDRDGAHEGD